MMQSDAIRLAILFDLRHVLKINWKQSKNVSLFKFHHVDPQFAGAAIIPSTIKYKEEIYFFFSEINKTARVDEEPYRARIGRICTVKKSSVDKSSSLHGFKDMFPTFYYSCKHSSHCICTIHEM